LQSYSYYEPLSSSVLTKRANHGQSAHPKLPFEKNHSLEKTSQHWIIYCLMSVLISLEENKIYTSEILRLKEIKIVYL